VTPQDIESRLLHRDGLMLIIDKPAGIPVHAGPGGGDNLERYLGVLSYGLKWPPALAHRLDRDTSGCLILGRHPKALRKLGKLFQEGRIGKTYWTIVLGHPGAESGQVGLALAKRSDARKGWKMVTLPADDPDGQKSLTLWQVRGRGDLPRIGPVAWIACEPKTGRTHQIRAHMAAIGHAVLGDPVYGGRPPGVDLPLQLHSRSITVPLQASKPPVTATAPVPAHMHASLTACGWPGEGADQG
jgi:tRNA pseudouridine32 synthase/23S rRNA pseudouridine746 synthase/23S rRNA pseudouridine1911/1915/1917 synthase